MILEPGYTDVDQVRILYSRVPAPLIYGQASAGAATSITLDTNASIIADVYNDDEIMLTGGEGEGQINTISDYSTARVATVSTWTTNPDATSYYSTLLAQPVSNYPELVAKGAAMRMLYKKRDSEQIQMLKMVYDEEHIEFLDGLIPRQADEPHYVNVTGGGEDDYAYWETP